MIVDCHCHVFTEQVVQNVVSRKALVEELRLDPAAARRADARSLSESAAANHIDYCILFPTAPPQGVRAENDRAVAAAASFPRLKTLATLHPRMDGLACEMERMLAEGIAGFKFCSFSQRFDIASEEAGRMLALLSDVAAVTGRAPVVVFDTFNRADVHFGATPSHITTPAKLNAVVRRYPAIRFLAAHMGGLAADFRRIRNDLQPAANLCLDTSNAAHVLSEGDFVELLQCHGAGHVLFGTDWPWFGHGPEMARIDALLDQAGFSRNQKEAVFGGNAEALFSLG